MSLYVLLEILTEFFARYKTMPEFCVDGNRLIVASPAQCSVLYVGHQQVFKSDGQAVFYTYQGAFNYLRSEIDAAIGEVLPSLKEVFSDIPNRSVEINPLEMLPEDIVNDLLEVKPLELKWKPERVPRNLGFTMGHPAIIDYPTPASSLVRKGRLHSKETVEKLKEIAKNAPEVKLTLDGEDPPGGQVEIEAGDIEDVTTSRDGTTIVFNIETTRKRRDLFLRWTTTLQPMPRNDFLDMLKGFKDD